MPDESWAARRLIQDYCTGALLHCEEPPVVPADTGAQAAVPTNGADTDLAAPAKTAAAVSVDANDSGSDNFSDVETFLRGEAGEGPGDIRSKGRQSKGRAAKG